MFIRSCLWTDFSVGIYIYDWFIPGKIMEFNFAILWQKSQKTNSMKISSAKISPLKLGVH